MSKEIVNTWIITDTHFHHENLVNICNRPVDFTEQIIKNWQFMIKEEDLVIHLGDITWNDDLVIDKLHGRKILVKGNHDKKSNSFYMAHGFQFSCESFSMYIGGMDIIFSHKPFIFHEHDINIHGHLHSLAQVKSICLHYPLALEATDYKPILLGDILPVLAKQVRARETEEVNNK